MRCLLLLLPAVAFAQPDLVVRDRPDPPAARAEGPFVESVALDGATATLGDALDAAPGAAVQRTGDIGRAEFLTLRGTTAQQVAVYLDDIPLGGGRGGAFDLSTLPVAWLSAAEVVRGPNAALYGSGAQGGVLVLRTGGALGLHARSRFGSGRLTQLDVSGGQAGDAELFVVGSISAAEGDTQFIDARGDRRTRENAGHQRGGGLARGTVRLGSGRLTVLAEGLGLDRGEPGPEQFPNATAESRQRRALGGLSWRSDAVAAMLFARVQRLSFTDPAPVFAGDPTTFDLRDRALGGRLSGRQARGDHAVELVGDLRHDAVESTTVDAARLSLGTAGVYTWTPTPSLGLSAALRLDDTDRRAARWVPQLGARWRLYDVTVRGNVGRALRDPSIDELYLRAPGIAGDPTLRPEDGWGGDLGLTWARGRQRLQAVGFSQRYDRLILFVPLDAYRIRASDAFQADVLGVELLAEGGVGPLFGSVTYTWLDATDPETGLTLPHRARHQIAARAQARIDRAVVHTAVGVRGEVFADRFGARTLPAYTRWQVGVEGPLGAGFAAGLQIRNLLDARALDAAQQPQPGRTFLATVTWDH